MDIIKNNILPFSQQQWLSVSNVFSLSLLVYRSWKCTYTVKDLKKQFKNTNAQLVHSKKDVAEFEMFTLLSL